MSPYDSPELVERRVCQAMRFMNEYNEEVNLLGTLEHFGPDYSPHELLPNYEEVARNHGAKLFYAGAEIRTLGIDEPFYYVLVSKKDQLTIEDVRSTIPGFEPIHPQEWRRAA